MAHDQQGNLGKYGEDGPPRLEQFSSRRSSVVARFRHPRANNAMASYGYVLRSQWELLLVDYWGYRKDLTVMLLHVNDGPWHYPHFVLYSNLRLTVP
jgi:hypothetical protein